MSTEKNPRSQICPKCGSEDVAYQPNPQGEKCPGDCDTDDPLRLGPDCCVGDECVILVCNQCGHEW